MMDIRVFLAIVFVISVFCALVIELLFEVVVEKIRSRKPWHLNKRQRYRLYQKRRAEKGQA